MNKKVFIFFLFFANFVFAEGIPSWLINVDKFCDKNMLCATGSGNTLNAAKTDARNNIQKVFETKVNSRFVNIIYCDYSFTSPNFSWKISLHSKTTYFLSPFRIQATKK